MGNLMKISRSMDRILFRRSRSSSNSTEDNSAAGQMLELYSFAARICQMSECKNIVIFDLSEVKDLPNKSSKYCVTGTFWKPILESDEKSRFPKLIQPHLSHKSFFLEKKKLKNTVILTQSIVENISDIKSFMPKLQELMNFSPICIMALTIRQPQEIKSSEQTRVRPNLDVIQSLLLTYDFNLQFIGFAPAKNLLNPTETVVAVIHNNFAKVTINKEELERFKVIALMATYNEEDIVRQSIIKLVNQGINVYVIDNWSTDSTYQILKELESKKIIEGSERFPPEGPNQYFENVKIYEREGEVAKNLKADWFMVNDVDEIIKSPWINIKLKDAIYLVDKMGYNAIDHTLLNFQPVNNDFLKDQDFEQSLNYFDFGKRREHFTQVRTWKNSKIKKATLGDIVVFKGRKILPYKFLLKHYPIRSQSHGEKKVFRERKARFCPEDVKKGMNIHYDKYQPGCSFLANPNDLIFFEEKKFYEEFLIERLSGIGIIR
jgi:hypothetical protein